MFGFRIILLFQNSLGIVEYHWRSQSHRILNLLRIYLSLHKVLLCVIHSVYIGEEGLAGVLVRGQLFFNCFEVVTVEVRHFLEALFGVFAVLKERLVGLAVHALVAARFCMLGRLHAISV